jgi:hypothetical protein
VFALVLLLNNHTQTLAEKFPQLGRYKLTDVESWVEANFDRCQVMECDDVKLLQQWATHWRDLVSIHEVACS